MEHASNIVDVVSGIVLLLLVAAVVLAMTKRIRLPFSVLLVMVGMGMAVLAERYDELLAPLQHVQLSPALILYVFLPTLIFESAYNLDSKQLRQNLRAVLTLAIPGLLLSTAIIGALLNYATDIPLSAALLLGAILSATDPVAVIALFKRLGAPKKLTVLMEGESLFNDAASIVLSSILVGIILAGGITGSTVLHGVLNFIAVFLGGLLVGWLLALLTGWLLSLVESDPAIEITLTTILAYASFIIAEHSFHVSGVMATVAAGLTLGGWGRTKMSSTIRTYVEHFWEYIAFVATALIFLMVGLRVDPMEVFSHADTLVWVIVAMMISRAVVIYTLIPIVDKLTSAINRTSIDYQTVMYWGGLRGAIAMAIALSLPDFEQAELFVTLVMGAVLFTLLVQGLTMETLVHWLGLDRMPLSDRLAQVRGQIANKQRAMQRLPELGRGGLFSGSIAQRLQNECENQLHELHNKLVALKRRELSEQEELNLLYLICFAEEKASYTDMFNKGHISEQAFKSLLLILSMQTDQIRFHGQYRSIQQHGIQRRSLRTISFRLLEKLPILAAMVERWQLTGIASSYEQAWGHYQASNRVLEQIHTMEDTPQKIKDSVAEKYRHWRDLSARYLDEVAEQYPEFVSSMQERLGRRLVLLAETDALVEQAQQGSLPSSVAHVMQEDLDHALWLLRGHEVNRLQVEPEELLRKVPFFQNIAIDQFTALVPFMQRQSVQAREVIIRQGEHGDALYLIARGVVRVSRNENGQTRDIASLLAGSFFGEMALLHDAPRNATVQAITPCTLYLLRRKDLEVAMAENPAMRTALEAADTERRSELY